MEFLQVKATEKSRSNVQYLLCPLSQASHEMKMHFLKQLYFGMQMELIKAETYITTKCIQSSVKMGSKALTRMKDHF